MKRNELFWGALLVVVGLLLLLNSLGILSFSVWGLIWPLFLIGLGGYILWSYVAGPEAVEVEEATIPLDGAVQGRVKISHGAGRLRIGVGPPGDQLLSGSFGGGLSKEVERIGDVLRAGLRVPPRIFPFLPFGRGGLNWDVVLNPGVPLELELETGAGQNELDLANLQVRKLALKTGASQTDLTLPAQAGETRARIETGVSQVTVRVPDGVAARIRVEGGLSSVNVDTGRFPRVDGTYRSPDYETAQNKVDLEIEVGVGSLEIH